LNVVKNIRSL